MWVLYIYNPYYLGLIAMPFRFFISNIALVFYILLLTLSGYT